MVITGLVAQEFHWMYKLMQILPPYRGGWGGSNAPERVHRRLTEGDRFIFLRWIVFWWSTEL